MKLPAEESRLRHPLERPLFWGFVLLNWAVITVALVVVFKDSDWIAAHVFLAKHEGSMHAFATAVIISVPAVSFIRNARHADILGNSIRISPRQLPEIYVILQSHCARLGIDRIPELFVSDDAIVEPARAYTSWNREYIVLGTRFFQSNLEPMLPMFGFLLGRELGRLRLGHASLLNEFLLSYVKKTPYVRNPLLLVFAYSEDRYGAYLAPEGIPGLITLGAGRRMFSSVNVADYLEQVSEYRGIWSQLAQLTKENPQRAHRINALYRAGLFQVNSRLESKMGSQEGEAAHNIAPLPEANRKLKE